MEGPHEAFVDRLHRTISHFGEVMGVAKPLVEFELADSSRFQLDRLEPEPGFGMVTIYVQRPHESDEPDALVIPIGAISRIELRSTPEDRVARFGFTVPDQDR